MSLKPQCEMEKLPEHGLHHENFSATGNIRMEVNSKPLPGLHHMDEEGATVESILES